MSVKLIWDFISGIGINLENNDIDIQRIRLINQFTVIVALVFLVHSLHNFFYLKDFYSGCLLFFVFIILIITFFLYKLRRIKFLVCLFFLLLCSIVFYYESYSGATSGIYLYYFPIALALPFIFNLTTDKKYIITIIVFMITGLLINYITDYSLFTNYTLTKEMHKNTLLVTLSICIFVILTELIFIFIKYQTMHELYERYIETENLLAKKQKQLDQETKVSAFRMKELTELAIANNPSFFPTFNETYPFFCPALLKKAPDLSISELELCAYIKLDFTTKEISQYSLLSIRAIEGRKYRIRKKLNFATEKDLKAWMMRLNHSKKLR